MLTFPFSFVIFLRVKEIANGLAKMIERDGVTCKEKQGKTVPKRQVNTEKQAQAPVKMLNDREQWRPQRALSKYTIQENPAMKSKIADIKDARRGNKTEPGNGLDKNRVKHQCRLFAPGRPCWTPVAKRQAGARIR